MKVGQPKEGGYQEFMTVLSGHSATAPLIWWETPGGEAVCPHSGSQSGRDIFPLSRPEYPAKLPR